jgi:hypothetical protein
MGLLMQRPKKRATQNQEPIGAKYPFAFANHHMRLSDVFDNLRCKYDVHRLISDWQEQCISYEIW